MAEIKGAIPTYAQEDEHIVRRLGWSVIVQWTSLPIEVRKLLVEQANHVHDREETSGLHEQLRIFLRKHARGAAFE